MFVSLAKLGWGWGLISVSVLRGKGSVISPSCKVYASVPLVSSRSDPGTGTWVQPLQARPRGLGVAAGPEGECRGGGMCVGGLSWYVLC